MQFTFTHEGDLVVLHSFSPDDAASGFISGSGSFQIQTLSPTGRKKSSFCLQDSIGQPKAIATGSSGNIFILDKRHEAARIVSYSSSGELLFQAFPGPALDRPGSCILVDPISNNLFIPERDRVRILDSSGLTVQMFGYVHFGSALPFSDIKGIALDKKGKLLIIDCKAIHILEKTGLTLTKIPLPNEEISPHLPVIDKKGNILILDNLPPTELTKLYMGEEIQDPGMGKTIHIFEAFGSNTENTTV